MIYFHFRFELIGQNKITVTDITSMKLVSYTVPLGERISVKKGDLIAILYNEGNIFSLLHLQEIMDELYFYILHARVCVCVCVCLCVSVIEKDSRLRDAPLWTRFSLNDFLLHWFESLLIMVKLQGHSD